MKTSIYTNGFPQGNPANGADQVRNKFTMDVYQGDTSDLQFMDSCAVNAGAVVPTGSICYVDNTNTAIAGIGTAAAGKVNVPCIVKVGTDKKTVQSEKYNSAGGIVTVLPLTGYFRLVTSVFDNSKTYEKGDLLTVGEFSFAGETVYGITKAAGGADEVIVGIVDRTGMDIKGAKGNPAVAFTACYRPVAG